MNSKVIDMVEDFDLCKMIVTNTKFPSKSGLTKMPSKNHQFALSDILLELEFVKHDLNTQLGDLKNQEKETIKYKKQFNDLESEMQVTIDSYKAIVEQVQQTPEKQVNDLKKEIENMQRQIANLNGQRNKL